MFGSFSGVVFSILTAGIVIGADYQIKLAADGHGRILSGPMAFGAALYLLSAVMWFYAMRSLPLGQAAVAYSMFTLVGLVVVGIVAFDETLEWRDICGTLFALGAMALMMRWI